jgi:hypothetical protein
MYPGYLRRWGPPGLAVLLCAALSILLVACGSAITTSGGPGAAPSATASPMVLSCGSISAAGPQQRSPATNDPRRAEECFVRAFHACQPATLQYTQVGVDSGVIHHFSIKQQSGRCNLIDATEHFIAPSPPRAAASYTCRDVRKLGSVYTIIGCGAEGDITLPAPAGVL